MKKYIIVLFLLSVVLPLKLTAQTPKGYEIVGHMEGIPDGSVIRVTVFDLNKWSEARDTTVVKNNEFKISGELTGGLRRCELLICKYPQINDPWKAVRLTISNGEKIHIQSGDVGKIDAGMYIDQHCTIEGSKSNYAFETFASTDFFYYQSMLKIDNYLKKLKDSIGFDPVRVEMLLKAKDVLFETYYVALFNEPARSKVAWPYFIYDWGNYTHNSFLVMAYSNLDEQQKAGFFGKAAKEHIALCVGQPFPLFTLPTADGKQLNLKDVIVKGKLTLIHFWAVNSYNRKEYEDQIRVFYKKYHDKGLNVIGVSSDYRESMYKEALAKERFPWPNISDLKGGDGIVNTVYHEWGNEATPNTTNVLVDAQGKIVAWDVRDLELQWYLYKYLGE